MIHAEVPNDCAEKCTACDGEKGAPLAMVLRIGNRPALKMFICEECGRDMANAIGFMCIREGGWSKLEPRKRRAKP